MHSSIVSCSFSTHVSTVSSYAAKSTGSRASTSHSLPSLTLRRMQSRLAYTLCSFLSPTDPQMPRQLAAALAYATQQRHAPVRQQLPLLLQSAEFCPFYISAVFSVRMKDHGFIQNHAEVLFIADIESFDSFLLRCHQ